MIFVVFIWELSQEILCVWILPRIDSGASFTSLGILFLIEHFEDSYFSNGVTSLSLSLVGYGWMSDCLWKSISRKYFGAICFINLWQNFNSWRYRGHFQKIWTKTVKTFPKKKFRFFQYVVHRWLCNNKNSHHTKQLCWKNVFGQNIDKIKYVGCLYRN